MSCKEAFVEFLQDEGYSFGEKENMVGVRTITPQNHNVMVFFQFDQKFDGGVFVYTHPFEEKCTEANIYKMYKLCNEFNCCMNGFVYTVDDNGLVYINTLKETDEENCPDDMDDLMFFLEQNIDANYQRMANILQKGKK